jgi:phosphatidylglycerophosphatase A
MKLAGVIASGLGTGRLPKAPGTAGSMLGLLIGAILVHSGKIPLSCGIIAASLAGMWAIPRTGAATTDPGWIVIDEIAGQMIAMLPLSLVSVRGLLLSFLLFRLFDIRKPWPISLADARHDMLGIMADDWLAGLFAAVFIVILRLIWPGWGI